MVKKHIGVDIGTYSIKCAVMEEVGDQNIIKYSKEYPAAKGLQKTLKKFAKEHQILFPKFHITLNNDIVKIMDLEVDNEKELEKALKFEIQEKTLIESLDEYFLKWDILKTAEDSYKVVSAVLEKSFTKSLKTKNVKTIEPQIVSMARLVEDKKSYAIIDLGHSATRIYMFHNGIPCSIQNIDFGGKYLDERIQNLEQIKNISDDERTKKAADLKEKYGAVLFGVEDIENNEFTQNIFNLISTDIEMLARNIKQEIRSFEIEKETEVNEVYFTGGTAKLKYLPEYLSRELELNLKPLTTQEEAVQPGEDYPYLVACGALFDGLKKINFINTRELNFKKPAYFLLGALLASQLSLGYLHHNADLMASQASDKLQKAKEQKENFNQTLTEYEAKYKDRTETKDLIVQIMDKKWLTNLLFVIHEKIPENIEITEIDVTENSSSIKGIAQNYSDIGFFASALEEIKDEVNIANIVNIDNCHKFEIILGGDVHETPFTVEEEVEEENNEDTDN